MKNSAFYTFKRAGLTFLLIPNGANCSICDSEGNNYGSYFDLKSFDAMAEKQGGVEALKIGRVNISYTSTRAEY